MKKQKQLIRIVVITIVGLILMGVGIHLFSLLNKTIHPLHLDTDKVHKITILSYDDERNAALSKAAAEKGEFLPRILCEKSDQPYRVSVIESEARKEIANMVRNISTTKGYLEKEDIQNEKKDYEVISYDENGKELQRITFYQSKVDSDHIYELDAPDEKKQIQNLCNKYNTPWIDDSYTSYMQKNYASEHNMYYVDGDFGYGRLAQADFQGNKIREYEVPGISAILGVTRDKIVFVKGMNKVCYLSYVAVEGKDDEIKNNEIVELAAPVPEINYVDSRYMMGMDEEDKVFVYDFESNRKIATTPSDNVYDSYGDEKQFLRCGTSTFIVSKGQIVELKEGSTTWERIQGENDGVAAWNDNILVYSDYDLYYYDVKKQEQKQLLGAEKLYYKISPQITEEEWGKLKIWKLFLEGNTLYIQMGDENSKEKNNYFFSVNMTNGKVTYWKELSNKNFCFFLKDGRSYMYYHKPSKKKEYYFALEKEYSFVVYDFKEKTLTPLSDEEFFSLCAYDKDFYDALYYGVVEK